MVLVLTTSIFITGCTPSVRVLPPTEPIEINMNLKIQQEVDVRVAPELKDQVDENPEIFGLPSSKSKS